MDQNVYIFIFVAVILVAAIGIYRKFTKDSPLRKKLKFKGKHDDPKDR